MCTCTNLNENMWNNKINDIPSNPIQVNIILPKDLGNRNLKTNDNGYCQIQEP